MRLIDATVLEKEAEESLCENPHTGIMAQAMHTHEHKHFLCMIANQPTIDPEALPIVRQLRAERDAALRELRGIQIHTQVLRDYVDDHIYPVVAYSVYLNLREAVDTIDSWQHITPDGTIEEA